MKTKILILLIFAATFTMSCSKDDDEIPGPDPAAVNNFYTFQDNRIAITDAEYYYVDGDTFLFFKGEDPSDYVQIIFADLTGNIPTGAFTYHGDRNSGYIENSHFWVANLMNEAAPGGYTAEGGSVISTSEPNGAYKISFLIVTNAGTFKGEYTGTLRPRE